MNNIYTKLLKFQTDMEAIKKDSTNPHFKSKYFDINTLLEEVLPRLNKVGLIVLQLPKLVDGVQCLHTQIIDAESGGSVDGMISLPTGVKPHEMGSALTYYRRYSLQAVLGLMAEDDDGNVSSGSKPAGGGFKAGGFTKRS